MLPRPVDGGIPVFNLIIFDTFPAYNAGKGSGNLNLFILENKHEKNKFL